MARLSLAFLGPFQVTLDGAPVTAFASHKVRALLAYLAVEAASPGRAHPRQVLAGLLWPDWPEPSALKNLRNALANLRQAIDHSAPTAPYLLASRESVQFNPASNYALDVAAFEAHLAASRTPAPMPPDEPTPPAAIAHLRAAVALYRGPFLEGFPVSDCAPFEAWAMLQREHLEQRLLDALGRLAAHHERVGEYAEAERQARRQLALDPVREEAHRQLMRALALAGARSSALAQYEACRKALAQELQVAPARETAALYEALRAGTWGPPAEVALAAAPTTILPPLVAPVPRLGEEVPESPQPLFVARRAELAHLEQWLAPALGTARGGGRVGFVVGEPGSGKTVLLREFARRAMLSHTELVVAGGTCNAYSGQGDPYLPFLEILRLLTGDAEAQRAAGALSREHARRLQALAPAALQAVLQVGPALIDALLSGAALLERARALPDGAAWEARVREALQHRSGAPSQAYLFDEVARVLQALAQSHPLLLILDDLQWADTGSINLLFHLARQWGRPGASGPRILILGAYRPEEVAAGRGGEPHPLQIVLHELQALGQDTSLDLAQAEGRAFVEALVDSEPNRLGPAFREALYRHTGGHALFSVELWRGLQQRGDPSGPSSGRGLQRDAEGRWVEGPALDWERLPRRVEAVIAAQIARLPRAEQELLAVASVEGVEFHAEVAARVLCREAGEVAAALSGALSQEERLVGAQSLRYLGEQRFSRYRFRHDLFQHYLYQHLDAVRHAHLHGEVARALEELGKVGSGVPNPLDSAADLGDDFDDLLGAPEGLVSEAQVAWHWEQAGLTEKAARYHMLAARRTGVTSFAHEETLSHTRQSLSLLATLPESPRRTHYEHLGYQLLGWALSMIRGQASPESGQALRTSLERAEQLGDPFLVADALKCLAIYHHVCGELDAALALNERSVGLAQGGPPAWVMSVQGELAMTLMLRGAFARAGRLLAPLADGLLCTANVPYQNTNHLSFVPWVLWCLGYPDQALRVGRATLEKVLREKDRHGPDAESWALCFAICFVHRLRREVAGVEQGLERLHPLVEAQRCFPAAPRLGRMYQGWVHAQRGLLEEGIAELRQYLADHPQRFRQMLPHIKGYLAEALARAGRVDEGLDLLGEALEQVERTREGFAEAELRRLQGELLLQRGDDAEEVEACFRCAIDVARRQEARSWELRATLSLARLLRAQGRAAEAREALAAIYAWFTEGFDTPDLVEAKALLDELARAEQA